MAVGIGPAKSGSSALWKLLCGFNGVACGSRQHPGGLRSGELNILLSDDLLREGLSAYDKFFTSNVSNEPLLLYEKTPVYSASFKAPFVAANILPENTKYIYTHRNFLIQDMSLYMHRKMYERNITYAKWVDDSLSIHKAWENCRRKLLSKVLLATTELVQVPAGASDYIIVDELFSNLTLFLPQEAYWTENQVSQSCGEPAPPFRPSDSFEELLHHRNINRWARYVGKDQILCIDDDTHKSKPCSVIKALTGFLKTDQRSLQNIECNVELIERTDFKRIVQEMPDLQTEAEVIAASERLRLYVERITKLEKKLVEVTFGSCKARFAELLT